MVMICLSQRRRILLLTTRRGLGRGRIVVASMADSLLLLETEFFPQDIIFTLESKGFFSVYRKLIRDILEFLAMPSRNVGNDGGAGCGIFGIPSQFSPESI